MLKRLSLYVHTLRFLKPIQLYYRCYYVFLKWIGLHKLEDKSLERVQFMRLTYQITWSNACYYAENTFSFLNTKHTFIDKIDWEFMTYGKLWQYNLAYFDYLNQPSLTKEEGLRLMRDFIAQKHSLQAAIDPYPTSLRIINWIKFISKHRIQEQALTDTLYAQALFLSKRIEYHLLGNHLLENAFALLHAGVFFQEERFYTKAKKIIRTELQEQLLADGGHFEGSPMYHQLLLYRVLEAVDLLRNNQRDSDLERLLTSKASAMLGWLQAISFSNGHIPMVNDATVGIAPDTAMLEEMGDSLNIRPTPQVLSNSAYRMFKRQHFEVLIDVGGIAPDYQPGHAHADTFNLLVYVDNRPVLVDTGISTYQVSNRRQVERGTSSHNTVTVNDKNQSEVWGGFRVARRAMVELLEDMPNRVMALHDGYLADGVLHERSLSVNEKGFVVLDSLVGSDVEGIVHWHFDAEVVWQLKDNQVCFQGGSLLFEGHESIEQSSYLLAKGFNQLVVASKIKVTFKQSVKTTFLHS